MGNGKKKYEQAKAYYLLNENLDVKATYVCENGFKLGSWIRTQRVSYKNESDHSCARKI